jgi:hypothetical protein
MTGVSQFSHVFKNKQTTNKALNIREDSSFSPK